MLEGEVNIWSLGVLGGVDSSEVNGADGVGSAEQKGFGTMSTGLEQICRAQYIRIFTAVHLLSNS